jgi:hypothetical protein
MSAWVIATIVVMVLIAVAFALFIAEADRERFENMRHFWTRPRDRRSRPRS